MAVNPIISSAGNLGRGVVDARISGVNGIRAGIEGVAGAAQEIAELNIREQPSSTPGGDRLSETASALVDLRVYQRQVEASAVVVKTADAVVGFLLDTHA